MTERQSRRVVIVGIGGVGGALTRLLARFAEYSKNLDLTLVVADGDAYETANAERQVFQRLGNKAEITVEELAGEFPSVQMVPVAEYITPENIAFFLEEGDIIFSCVDNHKTRNRLDRYVAGLQDAVLINGGNELTDGNVQVYIRAAGEDVTQSLCDVHEEIANPQDRSPDELSCDELAETSEPQLLFANMLVATMMATIFYQIVQNSSFVTSPPFGELYFDMLSGRVNPVQRTPRRAAA